MSDETMRDRDTKEAIAIWDAWLRDRLEKFAASEVARALAPRDPSPELVEAEMRLRAPIDEVKGSDARAIAAELDRLRAENARLRTNAGAAMEFMKAGIERHRQPDGAMCSCGGCHLQQTAIHALKAQPASGPVDLAPSARIASADVVPIRSRRVDVACLEEMLRREFSVHSAPWRNVAEAAARFVEGKGK